MRHEARSTSDAVRVQFGLTGNFLCVEAVSCVVAVDPCDRVQGSAAELRPVEDHLELTDPKNCSVELSVRYRPEAGTPTSLEDQIRIPAALDSEHVEEVKGLDHDG